MTTPFLTWLLEQFEQVETFSDSETPVGEGEEVLGKMDDDLRRLYTILENQRKDTVEWLETIPERYSGPMYQTVRDLPDAVLREIDARSAQLEMLNVLFYHEVGASFDVYDESIGIRSRFTVVKEKERPVGRIVLVGPLGIFPNLSQA